RRDLFLLAALGVFFEDDDLRVLAAKLDDRSSLRIEFLHRKRYGVHLLDKLGSDQVADAAAARAGDKHPDALAWNREFGLDPLQEFETLLGLLCLVALVVPPKDLVLDGINHHRFDRSRSDIKPYVQAVIFTRHWSAPARFSFSCSLVLFSSS